MNRTGRLSVSGYKDCGRGAGFRRVLLILGTALGLCLFSLPTTAATGKIVFSSQRGDGVYRLYTMDPDGANVTRITDGPADYLPRLSADGSKVVFDRVVGGSEQVYTVNTDGTNLTQLTYTAANNYHASWFPDGNWSP